MEFTGYLNNFTSGELGPDVWERSDLAQYATGCAEAFNFLGLPTGPNASRGGLLDVGSPKAQDKARRSFPWLRGDGEGLVLEFGDLYARVWTARGAKVLNGGTHVEFAQPYSEADLASLRLHQIGDIGLVTSASGLLFIVIKRLSDISWTAGTYDLRDGPWLAENSDETKTLAMTLAGSTWTATASAAMFTAAHVGATFRIRPPGGFPGYRSWAPNTASTAGDLWISAGRVYENITGATTGNTPPAHDRGEVSDGGVSWAFRHDGAGIFKITGYSSSTVVTGEAVTELPLASGDVTSNWSEVALSAAKGWPTALAAVREERLVLAASTPTAPDTIYLSQTAGFDANGASFKPGLGTGEVADDDAVRVGVGDKRARVVWLVDAINLIAGTTDGEYVVSGETVEDPLTPAGSKPRRISGHGSSDVPPVVVQGPPVLLLHVARGGTTLRELQLSGGVIEPQGRDLSILAQHVFGLGVKEMAWCRPDNHLWLRLADDSLACLTYHFEHGVLGVRRQPIAGGWKVEGLCASPDPDGRDRLHVAGYRTKGGSPQRANFVLATREAGVWADCAQQYSGAATTTITGLSRLAGEAVAVIADGARVSGLTVSGGGSLNLPNPAEEVTVGLPMLRRLKSLPLDPDRSGGMTGKKTLPTHAWVSFRCVEAQVYAQPEDDPDETTIYSETISSTRPSDLVPVVRRKREKVALNTNADRDIRIVAETSEPFDLIIDAFRYVVEAQ
jgi:hypothetical protein